MSKRRRPRLLRIPKIRRRSKPGSVPGVLDLGPAPTPAVIQVIAFDSDRLTTFDSLPPEKLRPLTKEWPVVWVNVTGINDAKTIESLADIFAIHELAKEDIVHAHQRAKVDVYDNLLYVVVRMVQTTGPYLTEQVSLFIGQGFVLTFLEDPEDAFDSVRKQLQQKSSLLRTDPRADYLAYRLIDAAIDSYFPLLEQLGDRLSDVDRAIMGNPRSDGISGIHQLRGELLLLRRAVWPHRDAINALARDVHPLISDATRTHLRDVYDHTVHLIDLVETYREICSDLRDQYMTAVSNRMNEIMKLLTVIATIFIPLSFITGLYGMNFNPEASPWNMPELGWRYGYPMALALMASVASVMLWFFYRRGWLKFEDMAEPDPQDGADNGKQ